MKIYIHFFIFLFSFTLFAQVDTVQPTNLETVQVKTKIIDVEDFKVQQVDSVLLKSNNDIILTSILNQMPGVTMQQGALNTSRVTIRGVGARSQFSTERLKLYINNIPLTNANGTSVLDDIDMNTLGNLEIIKGPKSTPYGANLGGNIILKTKNSELENVSIYSGYGSFDRFQIGTNLRQKLGKTVLHAFYNQLESSEFRENSDYERQTLNLFSQTPLSPKMDLNNIIIITRLKAFIPSSLNNNDFINNPEMAASNWFASAGFESYEKALLGTTLSYDTSDNSRLISSIFYAYRDGFEPRPFDILEENEANYGLRSVFNSNFFTNKNKLETSIGLELQVDEYNAKNFDNLYRNTEERGSVQGDLENSFEQHRLRFNAFTTVNYNFYNRLEVDAGLNFNFSRYSTTDLFLLDGLDQSGDLIYQPKLLPNLSLNYFLLKDINLFANYSIGVALPSVDESLDVDGFFNSELEASFGSNYEIGMLLSPLKNKIKLQINLFQMNIEDLIVARRVEEDRFIGVNAGSTTHRGLEILFDYNTKFKKDLLLNINTNLSLNDFTFSEFVDDDNDYSGNKIPAKPNYNLNFSANFNYKNRWILFLSNELVGEMALDDANSNFTEQYNLFNIKLSHQLKLFSSQISLNFGVNNLLNENFAASILPNAVGFGGAEPRFFYPSVPREFYFKVLINHRL